MKSKRRLFLTGLLVIMLTVSILMPAEAESQDLAGASSHKAIRTEIVHDSHLVISVSDVDDNSTIRVASVDLAKVQPGFFGMMSIAPDGEAMVYVTNSASLDDARIWVAQTDGSGTQAIATLGSEFWIVPPVWSPDSEQLAYVLLSRNAVGESKPELWTMRADGRLKTRLVHGPSFTPDLFAGDPADVIRWTADSTRIRYVNLSALRRQGYEVDVTSGTLRSWESADIVSLQHVDDPASISSLLCPLTRFSQQDPDFQPHLHTASCLSNYTMATGGCAITSLAMMLKYYGVDTNPRILDDTLGSRRCPLSSHWAEVATVGGAGRDITYVGAWDGAQWGMLENDLAAGRPVVVWLYRVSDRVSHYVLAIDGSGSSASTYTIADPWDGSTKSMQRYYHLGYTFAGLIRYEGTPHCEQDPPPSTDCLKPLLRYWHDEMTSHFYTSDWDHLGFGKSGWIYEG